MIMMRLPTLTSFSWLVPMLSMAIGLLGALFPVMCCSVCMCGDWRGGGGAEAEPPVGPIEGGGEGRISPATAWTVWRQDREGGQRGVNGHTETYCHAMWMVGHAADPWNKLICTHRHKQISGRELKQTDRQTDKYLFGGVGGGQVLFHLLLLRLADVVVCRILKVGLYLHDGHYDRIISVLSPWLIAFWANSFSIPSLSPFLNLCVEIENTQVL